MKSCRLPHRRYKIWPIFFWILWMTGPVSPSPAELIGEGGGPFPTRNYNPVQLLFLSLPAEKATTLPRGSHEFSLDLTESNTILIESTSQVDALLKFETFRAALNVKYGLTHRSEVGLEIPYYHRNRGLLDPLIMSIEDAFSDLNLDRVRFTDGAYGGYAIRRDGKIILSGEDHQFGLGDVVLSGKSIVLMEGSSRPAIALRGAVKFPTGDFDRAFGSGNSDFGFGLAAQKTLARRWIGYFNQNVIVPGGHFGRTDLTLYPIYTTAVALEFLKSSSFSFVLQSDLYTTPFRNAGAHLLDHGAREAVLGLNYRTRSGMLWQLYGIENLVEPAGASADFTLGTKVSYRF